jgi:fructose-1,6-bisphosphatase/inositol monophosphatase family enzyme
MNEQRWNVALQAARDAAAAAAEVIRYYWQRGVEVEIKSDATPVTIADREAEKAIRAVLTAALPDAAIYGEEFGLDGDRDGLLWLVDPLDGTKSFVRRTPFFSTQIALMHRGELVLGVSSAPIYGETHVGERGWRCVARWRARARRADHGHGASLDIHRQRENADRRCTLASAGRDDSRQQSHPRLRRFLPLPLAGARRPGPGDRVGS